MHKLPTIKGREFVKFLQSLDFKIIRTKGSHVREGRLIMEKDISKIKDKLKLVLEEEKGILFGYLFGSMALGKTNLESDIDLAFYLEEKEVKDFFKKRLFLMEKIQSLLKKRVDVIILNEARSIFFKFVIIKEGKIILERDHAQRINFELKTMQEYYDFRPFIKEYNEAYLQRSLKEAI